MRDSFINNEYYSHLKPFKNIAANPLKFIDIGARGGTHDIVLPLARNVDVLGFEPDKKECDRLMNLKSISSIWASFRMSEYAIMNEKNIKSLNITEAITNSSFLEVNDIFQKRYDMKKWLTVDKCNVETIGLDELISKDKNLRDHGEFIKIDTQGTELDVLNSAENTLINNCKALLIEVSFCELYSKQALFSEIESYLRNLGFSFYGFTSQHNRSLKLLDKKKYRNRERIIQADAVFFKDPFDKKNYNYEENSREVDILFVCAILLGYFDFAWEIAKKTWLINLPNEAEKLSSFIKEISEIDISSQISSVDKLQKSVHEDKQNSILHIGKFVDEMKTFNDFKDVLNISSLPSNYT